MSQHLHVQLEPKTVYKTYARNVLYYQMEYPVTNGSRALNTKNPTALTAQHYGKKAPIKHLV